MDPLLIQQQLKNNTEALFDFSNDLKSWGEEMKRKDEERKSQKLQVEKKEPTRQEIIKQKLEENNRAKKEILNEKNEIKKKHMSYADWDKFDADKECEKVDEESDAESNSDSLIEDLRDQAIIEKEQGNQFVKVAKWDEAVISYTNAIRYYAYDPIFYANRALCFLKTHQMEKAEYDCNIALRLDNTYVKAYLRRAAAREALNKLEDARLDLLRVLELEPKNSESRKKLEELTIKIKTSLPQKSVSKSSQSREHSKRQSEIQNYALSKETAPQPLIKEIDSKKPECIWPSGEVDNIVKAIQKPPHMRSKKPLVRMEIKEINSAIPECSERLKDTNSGPAKQNEAPTFSMTIKTEEIKIVEHKHSETNSFENIQKDNVNKQEVKVQELKTPRTSVQFHSVWKQLKGSDDKKSEYLKLINPKNIPNLFKDSLESQVFSEILLILAEYFTKERDETYEYIFYLSKIKRFSALSMFLTLNDKNSLWKMFNHMKEYEGRCKEEIDSLITKYELQ